MLRKVDWADVGERLVVYAVWLVRNRHWGCRNWDDIGLGFSPEDLASEAISDVVTGKCHFDPARGNLLLFLKQRIRWRLSNLISSSANRREHPESTKMPDIRATGDAEAVAGAKQDLERLWRRVKSYADERKRRFDFVVIFDAIMQEPGMGVGQLSERFDLTRGQVYYVLRTMRQLAQGLDKEET